MCSAKLSELKPDNSPNDKSDTTDIGTTYISIRSSLYNLVSRYLRQPQEIEDVVQEACVKALEAETKYKIQSPKSYLFRTARNLVLKELTSCAYRLNDNMGDLSSCEVLLNEITPENQYASQQKFAVFCQAVRELPVQCRRTFILRKVYGLTHKEIAAHLGISISTVEKHLAKAIHRCANHMHTFGYTSEKIRRKSQVKRKNG